MKKKVLREYLKNRETYKATVFDTDKVEVKTIKTDKKSDKSGKKVAKKGDK